MMRTIVSYVLLWMSITTAFLVPSLLDSHVFHFMGYGGAFFVMILGGVAPFLGSYFCYPHLIRPLFIPRVYKRNQCLRRKTLIVEFAVLSCGLVGGYCSIFFSHRMNTEYYSILPAVVLFLLSISVLVLSMFFFGRCRRMSHRSIFIDAVRTALRFLLGSSILTFVILRIS